jgi:type I restriction enzyme, R subunit
LVFQVRNLPLFPCDSVLAQAQRIDETIKRERPDDWRGVQARENVIKEALLFSPVQI